MHALPEAPASVSAASTYMTTTTTTTITITITCKRECCVHGGATCSGGDHICTIYYWGSYTKLYFTLGGGQQSSDSPAVLKKASADPLLCAEACLAEPSCTGAFFRFWSGECFVATAASPGAGNMMSTWVGQDAATQGGVTFVKWQGV